MLINENPEIADEQPVYFPNCEEGVCTLNHTFTINIEIEVDHYLTITELATIYILTDEYGFVNEKDEPIKITGGKVIFDYSKNPEKFYEHLDRIKDGTFEFILVNGSYTGSFDEIEIIPPDDYRSCKKFISQQKKEPLKYSAILTINSDQCEPEPSELDRKKTNGSNLAWWIILLIVVAIVIILSVLLTILVISKRSLRQLFLPYHKSDQQFNSRIRTTKN